MKKAYVSAFALLAFLLVLSAASATPLAPDYTKVGVGVGDVGIYRSSFTAGPWNKTKILVYGIVGTVVTLNYTDYDPGGSIGNVGQMVLDIYAGSFLLYGYLIAGNLTTGDALYSGATMTINATSQVVVAGALRTINHANYNGGMFNVYWDKATGLMIEAQVWFFGWGNYSLLSTTAWAPDSLLNMTTIALIEGVVIIILVIALVIVASRRRRG